MATRTCPEVLLRALVAVFVVVLATASAACGRRPPSPAAAAAAAVSPPRAPDLLTLAVPRVSGRVKIDAELDGKKMWEADTGTTRNFKDSAGHGMVPYTEAKARWGDGKLYLMLYAGDLDLEGTVRERDGAVERDDAFHIEIGSGDEVRTIAVSVLGTVADSLCRRAPDGTRACDSGWQSRAEVAVDRDGTLNKIGDNDEEWVVEMALPFAALGIANPAPGAHVPFSVRRCEVGHSRQNTCGSWGTSPRGELVLGS
jgi:hypothetical protein